jgi:cellulose synthase/poly-beta-1,6-N-acetylglucosamine synthase-like glycosyltransferase
LDSKISIFIPVYRESDLLKPLLNRILNDPYNLKEVFVIIDEPTKKSLELSEEFKDQVKFIFNGERKGKANVLNEAVKRSNGELLLFLDGDVAIPTEPIHFLETVFDEAKDVDIVEFKKNVIRDSFLARIVNYDYLSFNSTNWLFSLTLKKCLGFNGAAFAIKRRAFESLGGFRRVISEDLDLGTRSFIKGYSFKYTKKIEVHNKVSPSWRQWFKQRKRWGIGTALWLKDYYRDLLANTRKHPKILLPSLFLIFPSLLLFIINILIPNEIYLKLVSLLLFLIAAKEALFLLPIIFTCMSAVLIENLFATMGSLAACMLIFYSLARKLEYAFNPLEFTFFYFVYSPLWLLLIVVTLVRAMVTPNKLEVDWKI